MANVSWADVLRASAFLLENPDKWVEFKQRFGLSVAREAVKLAENHGLPADMVAQLKRDLCIDDD